MTGNIRSSFRLVAKLSLVSLLSRGKGYVFVLHHVVDLLLHCHHKEGDEVDQKDRPEDGNVEEANEGAQDGNN
jgi:hypothetical protein